MPKPAKIEEMAGPRVEEGLSETVPVWDPLVRLFHWSLVGAFALAWLSSAGESPVHIAAGYVVGILIVIRVAWGVLGARYARFSQFVRRPREIVLHILAAIGGRDRRYVGHNPAGGAMIVALLASISVLVLSGWMMTTDAFFGVDWVEHIHGAVANGILVLVALHVVGVVEASLRHRENLVRAMISGRKRAPAPDDIV
jgi:cytochrome b